MITYETRHDSHEKVNKEIWKDIKGYEGLYQASNYGNIRGLDRIIGYKGHKTRKWFAKNKKLTVNQKRILKSYFVQERKREN